MLKQLSEPLKSFQQITLFVIVPLLIAVHTEVITVAFDIIVWYIAISFGVYIFKTPLELYFIVKDKTRQLKENKQFYDKESYHQKDVELYQLEWRMFIFSVLSPFLALFSWYGLEKFCMSYSLTTLSNLLHPYFIIIAGFLTSYQPIIGFMTNFRERLDSIYPRLTYEPTSDLNDFKQYQQQTNKSGSTDDLGCSSSSSSTTSPPQPQQPSLFASSDSIVNLMSSQEAQFKNFVFNHTKSSEDGLRNELAQFRLEFSNYIKNLNADNNQLKRDIRDWTSKKSNEVSKIESRMLSLENQMELLQMLLEKEKATSSSSSSSKSDIFRILTPFSQKMLSLK
ncbi:hypothetical protein RB653_006867 [Dictyostelium firmibasis]|uniref:Uncharacterized protein n=1 Tax=Dictyostelium firmibasis TaxID=79012 RepID=A0AAN7U2V7_9MYCE